MRNFLLYWLPVVSWAILIFFFSTTRAIQTSDIKIFDFIIHKIAHLVEYAVLGVLSFRAVNKGFKKDGNWKIPLFLTIIYAITDEVHQLFIETREGKLRDIIIDGFGGFLGLWFQKHFFQNQAKKPKTWEENLPKD